MSEYWYKIDFMRKLLSLDISIKYSSITYKILILISYLEYINQKLNNPQIKPKTKMKNMQSLSTQNKETSKNQIAAKRNVISINSVKKGLSTNNPFNISKSDNELQLSMLLFKFSFNFILIDIKALFLLAIV